MKRPAGFSAIAAVNAARQIGSVSSPYTRLSGLLVLFDPSLSETQSGSLEPSRHDSRVPKGRPHWPYGRGYLLVAGGQ
jgi:hypothetical protein